MKKKIYTKKIVKVLFALTAAIILAIPLIQGCMETVQPEDVNKRILKTAVFRMIDESTGELVPIRGADVTLYEEVNGGLNELKILQTNENGFAIFDLEVPVIGKLYTIKATYNNESQSKSSVLICRDTTINFIFTNDVNNIDCANLNQTDSLRFFDNDGSSRLKRNTPANINQYERCKTYTIDNSNTGTIEVQLPSVPAPFSYISIYANDTPMPLSTRKLTLAPGEKFTLCFAVNTSNAGIFNERIPINISCSNGNTGTANLDLKADVVEPSCECEDMDNDATVLLDERVMQGESLDFKDIEVFTNNSACTVVITKLTDSLNGGWTITSPTFPVTLAKGSSLKVSGSFAPTQSGTSKAVLHLNIQPEGTSTNCPLDINFEGEGCYNSCPFIGYDNRFQMQLLGTGQTRDTISNRTDGKVFISATGLVSGAVQSYFIKNPDSACAEVTITIESFPADNFARTFYSVSPTRLTLLPGETGQIDVSFTAPTLDELNQALEARNLAGPPYRTIDSMFTTRLRISGANCTQDINVDALVTAFPDISPIINLRAYNQSTTQKPVPENEVYYFGFGSRSILKGTDGSNGPYPPTLGDIWIDVNDNNQSANPPQEPILKLIHGAIEIKLWKNNYQESLFSDVPALVTAFAADPLYNTGYGPGPITGIAVNDVYAVKFDDMTYALIFIRRVDNGTESTSSKQSGIEFRSVYPIYIY